MSLVFEKPTIKDKDLINKILFKEKRSDALAIFGTYFLWSDYFNTKVCMHKNILFTRFDSEHTSYLFPKGTKSILGVKNAMDLIFEDYKKLKLPQLYISGLDISEVIKLEKVCPKKFDFITKRDKFEYVYSSTDLANLKGKKYHSKRNHISKFEKTYSWNYEKINISNKKKYIEFFEKWFAQNTNPENKLNSGEYEAIIKALDNYEELGLYGGAVIVDGQIVACAIGEKINKKVFVVHFEKALAEFDGAYAVINREFSKDLSGSFKYINREEDLGIEGLRKAKLSYKPSFLISRFDAILKEE
ncbi:MAG: DUF2156 domain-containing protein [Clostridia bacterium]|nr:DUF2156 domain-containing protein [Clostridia bacterium]